MMLKERNYSMPEPPLFRLVKFNRQKSMERPYINTTSEYKK